MIKLTSFIVASALFISGCSTGAQTLASINETVPMRTNTAAITIISPQNFHGSAGFAVKTNYDYFLDCLEDRCKVGMMNPLQYITLYPTAGKHTLYTRLSSEGFANSLILTDKDEMASISFDANTTDRAYISHEWELSAISLAGPFAVEPSILKPIDEDNAKVLLQKLLDGKSRMPSFLNFTNAGQKGTTYQP